MAKKALYLVAILLLIFTCFLVYDYFSFTQTRNQFVQQKGQETTDALRNQVDGILSKISKEGERLANLLGSNDYSPEEIEELIKESSLSIKEIQGVTACFEPFAFSSKKRLYCPYYDKGTSDYFFVGKSYDYSITGAKGTAWYTGVRDEGAKWVEPYFGEGVKDWFVDYGIPFHYNAGPNKGKVRGTITMSFVCGGFKELVHSLSIGKTGYGIITSNKGKFLVHPINDFIGTTNLRDIAQEEKQAELSAAYTKLLNGEQGNIEFYDEDQKDKTLFFFDKIPTSGWGMGLMFFKNDLLNDSKLESRKFINILLALSLLLVVILAIYYGRDYLDEREIWQLSALATVLLIANIFVVGYLKHSSTRDLESKKSPPIIDMSSLGSFVNQQDARSEKLKTPKLTPVPTGIYIQRIQFEDSYNLSIGGTVWQKYPLEIADKVEIGFTFPQMSPFAEASFIEESYRKKVEPKEGEPGHLLVGWDVRVTLRLNLKYADYPFDKRHINIEFQPLNNNDYLIFTPDLSSYSYTNPSKKSGLNPKIKVSGSEVLESYFNYSTESYDTDFGYGQKGLFEEVPILHFNIHIRRLLLNAFITYLIPIFVTLAIVFLLLLSCTKTAERQGVVESMAAFFFVLIFSHIDLRKEIVTADLIYMEYFYFISYLVLVLTTFNLITYTKDKSDIFDFNQNQIFKAIYFPMFLFVLLLVTLMKFY